MIHYTIFSKTNHWSRRVKTIEDVINKILVYKKKRRKGYEKKRGHTQKFSTIKVEKLSVLKDYNIPREEM